MICVGILCSSLALADNVDFTEIASKANFLKSRPEVTSLIDKMAKDGWSFYGFLHSGSRAFGDAYEVDLFFVKYDRTCRDMIKPQLTRIVKLEVASPSDPAKAKVSLRRPSAQSPCPGRTERIDPNTLERTTVKETKATQ